MITDFEICRLHKNTKKSRYFDNETLFFLQIKKFISYTPRVTLYQKYFCNGGKLSEQIQTIFSEITKAIKQEKNAFLVKIE